MKNNITNTPETWRPWLGADYNARVFALTVQCNQQGGEPISPVELLRELIDRAEISPITALDLLCDFCAKPGIYHVCEEHAQPAEAARELAEKSNPPYPPI
jgi:hypothetical protein